VRLLGLLLEYPAGYFNVYRCWQRRIRCRAPSGRLRLGVHQRCGDGPSSTACRFGGGRDARRLPHAGATYRSDIDLQAAHATHPFIVVWDDHEIVNDASREGAPTHKGTARDWQIRQRAAYQAYLEWMPVREATTPGIRLFRDFRFGRLVDLLMLDTGLPTQGPPLLSQRSRALLGAEQEAWFRQPPPVGSLERRRLLQILLLR
jgi:hypothetical protein